LLILGMEWSERLLVWSWFFGLGKNVNRGFDQGVADVVVEQAARNFFELLVANNFRSDFVAHFRYGVLVRGCWFGVVLLFRKER
jgi:hypothetical protein